MYCRVFGKQAIDTPKIMLCLSEYFDKELILLALFVNILTTIAKIYVITVMIEMAMTA